MKAIKIHILQFETHAFCQHMTVHTLLGETLSRETIRWAKFSSPNEKYVPFAGRKFRPIKVKVSLVEVQVNLRGVQVIQTIVIISLGETLPGEIFVAFKDSSL